MKTNDILLKELLELYFAGETTLEQERQLRDYFAAEGLPADGAKFLAADSGEEMPAELEYARAMFGFFGSTGQESSSCELRLPFEQKARPAKVRRMGLMRRAVSIAAAVAVVATGATFWAVQSKKPVVYCYVNGEPVTDFDYASRQAEMAARILAGNMKTSSEGIDAAVDAGKHMEQLGRALRIAGVELEN